MVTIAIEVNDINYNCRAELWCGRIERERAMKEGEERENRERDRRNEGEGGCVLMQPCDHC